jgi:hypothetical protein
MNDAQCRAFVQSLDREGALRLLTLLESGSDADTPPGKAFE